MDCSLFMVATANWFGTSFTPDALPDANWILNLDLLKSKSTTTKPLGEATMSWYIKLKYWIQTQFLKHTTFIPQNNYNSEEGFCVHPQKLEWHKNKSYYKVLVRKGLCKNKSTLQNSLLLQRSVNPMSYHYKS